VVNKDFHNNALRLGLRSRDSAGGA